MSSSGTPYLGAVPSNAGGLSQIQYNGIRPPASGFGAKFDCKTFGTPVIAAGSKTLSINWPSVTLPAAVTGSGTSITPQLITISSSAGLSNGVNGFAQICINLGQTDEEHVALSSAGNYTGGVSGATNASPIILTLTKPLPVLSAGVISTSGILGNTNANVSNAPYIPIDSLHVSLTGTTGNAAYTSGGTFSIPVVTGPFLLNHAAGATVIPVTFKPGDPGKHIGIGGCGSTAGPLWPTLSAGLALGMQTSPQPFVAFTAQGWGYSGGYAIIGIFAQGGPITWTIYGSNSSTFATQTAIYTATIQPMAGNPNARDTYVIGGTAGYLYYRALASSTASGAILWGSYSLMGNMLSSTIATYINCNSVMLADAATTSLAPLPTLFGAGIAQSFFGTDDTPYWAAMDSGIHGNDFDTPAVFGQTVILPKGVSLVRGPLYNNGSVWDGNEASMIYFDPSGTYPQITSPTGITTCPLITMGWPVGSDQYGFFTKIINTQIYANDIPGTCVIYNESTEELSGLDNVSIFGFTQIGVLRTSNYSQNWLERSLWILPGYANYAIASTYLTQAVTAQGNVIGATNANPIILQLDTALSSTGAGTITVARTGGNTAANGTSMAYTYVDSTHVQLTGKVGNGAFTSAGVFQITSAQTISVNRTDYLNPHFFVYTSPSSLLNVGEFTANIETVGVTATPSATSFTAVFSKNHAANDELLPFYQPTCFWAYACSGKGVIDVATLVALSGFQAGMGIGFRNMYSNVATRGFHYEGAAHGTYSYAAGLEQHGYNSGNFNLTCMASLYPHNTMAVESKNNDVETGYYIIFNGIKGTFTGLNTGNYGVHHYSLSPNIEYHGAGQNDPGYLNGPPLTQGIFDAMSGAIHVTPSGLVVSYLLTGDSGMGRPGPMLIGNPASLGRFLEAQEGLGGNLYGFYATSNGTVPVLQSISGSAAQVVLRLVADYPGISTPFIIFGDNAATVDGFAVPIMGFGNKNSIGRSQWTHTGTGGYQIKWQFSGSSGAAYVDALIANLFTNLFTFAHLTSSDLNSGPAGSLTLFDGTQINIATALQAVTALLGGTAPTDGDLLQWSAASQKVVCVAPPSGSVPGVTNQPLGYNSGWFGYSPATLGGYLVGGTGFTGTFTLAKLTSGGTTGIVFVQNGGIAGVIQPT